MHCATNLRLGRVPCDRRQQTRATNLEVVKGTITTTRSGALLRELTRHCGPGGSNPDCTMQPRLQHRNMRGFLYCFKPPFPSDGGFAAVSAGRSGLRPAAARLLRTRLASNHCLAVARHADG